MMRSAALALAAALALSGCSPAAKPAPETPRIDGMIAALYRPYSAEPAAALAAPDWDQPVFSAGTQKLIEQWKQGFTEDNVLELQDFDWFCECQDWDPKAFKFAIDPHDEPTGGRIEVAVRLTTDGEGERRSRLSLVRDGGGWKIDDLFSKSFPDGLKTALQRAIRNNLADPV